MSEILTNNKYYKDIADTIRQMKGVATTYKPREMAGALRDMYSTEVEGVPPLTFPSNGNNLLNYRIDGANGGVGDLVADTSDENYGKYKIPVVISGKNLWNEDYTDIPVNIPIYKPLYLGEGTFTLSTSAPLNANNAANLFLMSGNVTQGASTNTTGCWNGHPITAIANNGYVTIAFRSQFNVNPADYQSQLELGSQATNYEPYHEPVTTNIYLDEPIEANESKSLSDTNVNIPTINGTNILSIDTTVQPSNVYVQAPKTNNYNL